MESAESRRPKGPIKFMVQLNEEQKAAKALVFNNDVNIILGNAGSGKTLLACNIALDMLFNKLVEKIIVIRPIDFEATGYLKGSFNEKAQYHMMPIKQNFYATYKREKIDSLYADNSIEVLPLPYLRGVNFSNSVVIFDEAQEANFEDFKLSLTRLCKGSKIIYTGSVEQNTMGAKSCINQILKLKDSGLVGFTELKTNHRNQLIYPILEYLEQNP